MEFCKVQLLCFCLFTITIVEASKALNESYFDVVWQKRAVVAKEASLRAYNSNPIDVAKDFNDQVYKYLIGNSTTRRNLKNKKYHGPCKATNPIDRCWRCDPNWANNRKKLADCVQGFGRGTTGGKDGRFYVVTDSSDDDLLNPKPGTLRHAVIQPEPLWIIFSRSMFIRLTEELLVTSNKTIDARGANVHICYGGQITLQFVQNVIIHGLHIHDIKAGNGGMIRDSVNHYGIRTRSDGDGISLYGVTNVWIDHVSLRNCQDGMIDVIMESTAITISNCHFTHHNEVLLFGGSGSFSDDKVMQITLAFNHFGQGLVQRMPRVRFGFVHVVNNDYTHWLMYAIGGSQHPTILSQGNRFIAPPDINCKEVTKREYAPESEWKSWDWRSQGDLMMNGAYFIESGNPIKTLPKKDVISWKTGSHVSRLTRFSGALNCVEKKPC